MKTIIWSCNNKNRICKSIDKEQTPDRQIESLE